MLKDNHVEWFRQSKAVVKNGFDQGPGTLTKVAIQHIASIQPTSAFLQLQVREDLDLNSLLLVVRYCQLWRYTASWMKASRFKGS